MKDLRVLTSPEQVNYNMRFEGSEEPLAPVVCVDNLDGFKQGAVRAIRMAGYVNDEAVSVSLDTGLSTFYSRSKERLWTKGEESGNVLKIRGAYTDCDADCVIFDVEPNGPTCHTGADTCFLLDGDGAAELEIEKDEFDPLVMKGVWDDAMGTYASVIAGKAGASESYTQRTARDINVISKKIGEEACELVRAYTLGDKGSIVEESADLFYRMIFLLSEAGIPPQDFFKTIGGRNKK